MDQAPGTLHSTTYIFFLQFTVGYFLSLVIHWFIFLFFKHVSSLKRRCAASMGLAHSKHSINIFQMNQELASHFILQNVQSYFLFILALASSFLFLKNSKMKMFWIPCIHFPSRQCRLSGSWKSIIHSHICASYAGVSLLLTARVSFRDCAPQLLALPSLCYLFETSVSISHLDIF